MTTDGQPTRNYFREPVYEDVTVDTLKQYATYHGLKIPSSKSRDGDQPQKTREALIDLLKPIFRDLREAKLEAERQELYSRIRWTVAGASIFWIELGRFTGSSFFRTLSQVPIPISFINCALDLQLLVFANAVFSPPILVTLLCVGLERLGLWTVSALLATACSDGTLPSAICSCSIIPQSLLAHIALPAAFEIIERLRGDDKKFEWLSWFSATSWIALAVYLWTEFTVLGLLSRAAIWIYPYIVRVADIVNAYAQSQSA